MRNAPLGLILQACLAGLAVQVGSLIFPCRAEFSVFLLLLVMYIPIVFAVNMGYWAGQKLRPAKDPVQDRHDIAATTGQPQSPPPADQPPAHGSA